MFAPVALLAFGFVWLYIPETKGHSLEEIGGVFQAEQDARDARRDAALRHRAARAGRAGRAGDAPLTEGRALGGECARLAADASAPAGGAQRSVTATLAEGSAGACAAQLNDVTASRNSSERGGGAGMRRSSLCAESVPSVLQSQPRSPGQAKSPLPPRPAANE